MSALLEQFNDASATQRGSAAAKYRQLIHRHENPQPGDAAELRDAMATLSITAADAADDVTALNRARELEGLILSEDDLAKLDRDLQAADAAYREACIAFARAVMGTLSRTQLDWICNQMVLASCDGTTGRRPPQQDQYEAIAATMVQAALCHRNANDAQVRHQQELQYLRDDHRRVFG